MRARAARVYVASVCVRKSKWVCRWFVVEFSRAQNEERRVICRVPVRPCCVRTHDARVCHKTTHALEANDELGNFLVGTHFTSPSLVLISDFL